MMNLRGSLRLLLASTLSFRGGVVDAAASAASRPEWSTECPEDLPHSKTLADDVEMCYAYIPSSSPDADDGVLKGRVEYDGEGWLAVALSMDEMMPGSQGIIGLPDDGTVMKYDVGAYVSPTAMSGDKQTLLEGSISQEDGLTTLTFTKLLKEKNCDEIELVEGTNRFIYGYGSTNYFPYNVGRGAFELDLIAPDDSAAPTRRPTTTPPTSSLPPTSVASKCPEDLYPHALALSEAAHLCYAYDPYDPSGGVFRGRMEYRGEGWLAVALSRDAMMPGSEGIIGLPDDGTVLKYDVGQYAEPAPMPAEKQTLSDETITQEDGVTTMTFTKLLKEEGDDQIEIVEGANSFVFAYGADNTLGYHLERGAFDLDLVAPDATGGGGALVEDNSSSISSSSSSSSSSPHFLKNEVVAAPLVASIYQQRHKGDPVVDGATVKVLAAGVEGGGTRDSAESNDHSFIGSMAHWVSLGGMLMAAAMATVLLGVHHYRRSVITSHAAASAREEATATTSSLWDAPTDPQAVPLLMNSDDDV